MNLELHEWRMEGFYIYSALQVLMNTQSTLRYTAHSHPVMYLTVRTVCVGSKQCQGRLRRLYLFQALSERMPSLSPLQPLV